MAQIIVMDRTLHAMNLSKEIYAHAAPNFEGYRKESRHELRDGSYYVKLQ